MQPSISHPSPQRAAICGLQFGTRGKPPPPLIGAQELAALYGEALSSIWQRITLGKKMLARTHAGTQVPRAVLARIMLNTLLQLN